MLCPFYLIKLNRMNQEGSLKSGITCFVSICNKEELSFRAGSFEARLS